MSGRRISIIVSRAPGNDIDTLKRMTAVAVRTLTTIASGEIIELEHSATGEN
jgi:hypothetical protein